MAIIISKGYIIAKDKYDLDQINLHWVWSNVNAHNVQ